MASAPLSDDELQPFIEALDAAGAGLRELLDNQPGPDAPVWQFYLDGAVFLEIGYLMVEQFASDFPAVFRALHDAHYAPVFAQARRGQIGWGEALEAMPEVLRAYATESVRQGLEDEEDPS